MSNEMEKTIEFDWINNSTEPIDRIHITQIDSFENSDDENLEEFPVIHRTLSNRTATVTSNNPDLNLPEFHKSDRHEIRVSWINIPDRNKEHERDELVLYVQRNSRMVFAGVIEQSLLSDEYLKKLVRILLTNISLSAGQSVYPGQRIRRRIPTVGIQ
jgi:hypothetical protein